MYWQLNSFKLIFTVLVTSTVAGCATTQSKVGCDCPCQTSESIPPVVTPGVAEEPAVVTPVIVEKPGVGKNKDKKEDTKQDVGKDRGSFYEQGNVLGDASARTALSNLGSGCTDKIVRDFFDLIDMSIVDARETYVASGKFTPDGVVSFAEGYVDGLSTTFDELVKKCKLGNKYQTKREDWKKQLSQ